MTDKFYKNAKELLNKLAIKSNPVNTNDELLNTNNFSAILITKN